MIELPKRFREPVLVAGTDGVGTKLKFAFALGKHDTIGIDLVAMSVNDILVQGAEPLFFLDYYVCERLEVDVATEVIKGIARGCEIAGCALIGGETAEHPRAFTPGEYDLAGFAVGVVEKSKAIDGGTIAAGDVLIGLASSGPHSNGFSLIRSIVESSGADLRRAVEGVTGTATLGEALLTPTRIYVKPVLTLLAQTEIKGMAHITGGGLSENTHRMFGPGLAARIDAYLRLAAAYGQGRQRRDAPRIQLRHRSGAGRGSRNSASNDRSAYDAGRSGLRHRRGRAAKTRLAGHDRYLADPRT